MKGDKMATIKTVGRSGQISLGKKYAGRQILVDEIESGVWILKVGKFIPANEQWLYSQKVTTDLDQAIDWAEKNPPQPSDLNKLEKRTD
jgi:hypothetical protein